MSARGEPSSTVLTIVFALGGGIVFAGLGGAGGFFSGLALGALLAQVWHLRSRTEALSHQVRELNARLDRGASAAPEPEPEPVLEPAPVVQPPPVTPGTAAPSTAAVDADFSASSSTPAEPPKPRVVVKYEPTAFDKLVARGLAWIKGGNPLARIGIVILFFGGAFLAKYAADHSLFPIELRFLLIALGAFALLFIGWRLRESRSMYAQILQGGGIAGLYLTVFAATKFGLLPVGLALGLMVGIAFAGAVLAVVQDALPLAVIGTAGGFMAPILVSTGGGNHVVLFSYYALLNLGVFAVAWFRTWRVLNVLGFVFTFTITGLWRATSYERVDLFSADAFLILFFLMYVAVSVLNAVRQPPNLKGYVSGSLVFGLPVVAFGLHASLLYRIEYALAWSALILGLFYLMLGFALYRARRDTFRLLIEAFAALGVIFASLAIPLAFDSRTTAAMWAIEGAGLLWLGVRQARRLPRAFGTLLQLAAAVGFFMGSHIAVRPVLNGTFIGAAMIALAGYFSGYWLHRNREQAASYEQGAHIVFAFWATLWWLFAGLHEIDLFVDAQLQGAALAFGALTALGLYVVARRTSWTMPAWIALYLPAVFSLGGVLYALDLHHPFAQWGAAGWIAILVVHFFLLRAWDSGSTAWGASAGSDLQRRTPSLTPTHFLHAGAACLIALLLAWEVSWHVREHTLGVWRWLSWGLAPALLLAWLGRRELVPAWPLIQHEFAYRLVAGVPLAIWGCTWILLVNLSSDGSADWLPYVPVLNPLDVSVALVLVALGLWWTTVHSQIPLNDDSLKALAGVVAVLVFIWLNAALLRALHHVWGAPFGTPAMLRSTLVQASLSIFWGLLGFAAMTTAAKKHWRIVWLVGAALMIIVVLKLFLVDLSKSGTLARIASFLTVGALLLVTGYLAPLPPRRTQESSAA